MGQLAKRRLGRNDDLEDTWDATGPISDVVAKSDSADAHQPIIPLHDDRLKDPGGLLEGHEEPQWRREARFEVALVRRVAGRLQTVLSDEWAPCWTELSNLLSAAESWMDIFAVDNASGAEYLADASGKVMAFRVHPAYIAVQQAHAALGRGGLLMPRVVPELALAVETADRLLRISSIWERARRTGEVDPEFWTG
jgi:hypothetical protein